MSTVDVMLLKNGLGFLSKFWQFVGFYMEIREEPTKPDPPMIAYFIITFLTFELIYP